MKKAIFSTLLFFLTFQVFAQTEGISYQAVIIGPDKQELPGVDATGNILPNASIAIRFTILDATNNVVYQEVQKTQTDQYGRINLLIGKAKPDEFKQIDWDGTAKDLKVEIDFKGGANFVDMSREVLTFIPYAYHRNITAHGTLIVDGATDLNGELKVQGPTNLNSTLNVNNQNATNLSGVLNVEGHTNLNDGLTVKGITQLDSLDISGALNVKGKATFDGPTVFNEPAEFVELKVNGPSNLKGQVTIDANLDSIGGDSTYDAYPLIVQGSKQGIAVRTTGTKGANKNYVSFWDNDKMWGRIEGVANSSELNTTVSYIRGLVPLQLAVAEARYNLAKSIWEAALAIQELVAASTSSTACVGLGACVTTPIISEIIFATISLVFKVADVVVASLKLAIAEVKLAKYILDETSKIGATFVSGSGDYAEWLPKKDPSESYSNGELVGIENGLVTKNPWSADKVMIVSTRPIVLGNMPQPNDENSYVKIAFMGQVPVKVLGPVEPGDYILPGELSGEFGKAIHPKDMKIEEYKKVVGVAWLPIKQIAGDVSVVNVAVGINTNDMSRVINKQGKEIAALRHEHDKLKLQIEKSNNALANLLPGYAEAMGISIKPELTASQNNNVPLSQATISKLLFQQNPNNSGDFKISKELIATALDMVGEKHKKEIAGADITFEFLPDNRKNQLQGTIKSNNVSEEISLMPIVENPIWKRLEADPTYKEHFINVILGKIDKAYQDLKKGTPAFTNLPIWQ